MAPGVQRFLAMIPQRRHQTRNRGQAGMKNFRSAKALFAKKTLAVTEEDKTLSKSF
jgi:hypothetical protein